MNEQQEVFWFQCPHCGADTKQTEIAAKLDNAVLLPEAARRRGRLQKSHAGPGRPTLSRCPGCDEEMSTAEIRDHRVDCVRKRFAELQNKGYRVHLQPKDPDPYPDFKIANIEKDEVRFQKMSSGQYLDIELRKIAEITADGTDRMINVRLLGQVIWDDSTRRPEWRFVSSRIGRPRTHI